MRPIDGDALTEWLDELIEMGSDDLKSPKKSLHRKKQISGVVTLYTSIKNYIGEMPTLTLGGNDETD